LSLRLARVLVLLAAGCTFCGRQQDHVRAAEADPDGVCASCHRDVYERYRTTPMANASGRAADGLIPANFVHPASGVHYRVYSDHGTVWMSYTRDASADPAMKPLDGRKELRFYVGSGKRGRTFLFEEEGYWFEAPINWYAKKGLWDMAPNHLSDREAPLTMPVDPGCLHCHVSGVAASLPDARNHYSGMPFFAGGISCEGCHGDASAHLASQGRVAMAKIDALEPVRRLSVCLNCHLEGETAIDRLGKKAQDFRPGDNLFDYSEFFVHRDEEGSGGRATSQWEALLQSECKKKSGDRMTCTTCHDPHRSPSPEERVAFYRRRCLQCHNKSGFASRHHPATPDCTGCHMARSATTDIAHEQVTDHLIRRRVPEAIPPVAPKGALEAIGMERVDDRGLGLAYAQMAARGDSDAGERAMKLLSQAEREAGGAPQDSELHTQLGFLEQVSGHPDAAAAEYEQAIKIAPYDSVALGDLGLIRAGQHQYAAALRLWNAAFGHDPVQIGAGLNVAVVACQTGHLEEAENALKRVLEFAPDDTKARDLLDEISSGKKICGVRPNPEH
jgi:predicted CXXCH cytochrome family protein